MLVAACGATRGAYSRGAAGSAVADPCASGRDGPGLHAGAANAETLRAAPVPNRSAGCGDSGGGALRCATLMVAETLGMEPVGLTGLSSAGVSATSSRFCNGIPSSAVSVLVLASAINHLQSRPLGNHSTMVSASLKNRSLILAATNLNRRFLQGVA